MSVAHPCGCNVHYNVFICSNNAANIVNEPLIVVINQSICFTFYSKCSWNYIFVVII
jgi:hypothetical protein